MYRIPNELDLSATIGQFTTQFCVGAFDVQFDLGDVHFAVQSEIRLYINNILIGHWQPGSWPTPEFRELFNVDVVEAVTVSDTEIKITFENSTSLHLYDNSDQYESMQISIKGEDQLWII